MGLRRFINKRLSDTKILFPTTSFLMNFAVTSSLWVYVDSSVNGYPIQKFYIQYELYEEINNSYKILFFLILLIFQAWYYFCGNTV